MSLCDIARTKNLLQKYNFSMESKHYFLSANTNEGFCNYFDFATSPARDGYVYILKGGSGTGKSTLMKNVGKFFGGLGESIEYFHCSSDPESLDGVLIRERNVAVVDGTSPHVREANIPGTDSKIINLGESISDSIRTKRKEIEKLYIKKKHAYSYIEQILEVVGKLYEINVKIEKNSQKSNDLDKLFNKFIEKVCGDKLEKEGCVRHLFRTVLSDDGEKNFDKDNAYKKVLKARLGVNDATELFFGLSEIFEQQGYEVICFHDYLSPKNIESLYLPERGVLIERASAKLNLGNCPNLELYVNNEFMIDGMLAFATKFLAVARGHHFEVEKIYRGYVDFSKHKTITSEIISDIKTNFPIN